MSKSRPISMILLALFLLPNACAPATPEISEAELQQTVEVVVALTALAQNATAPASTVTPQPPTITPEPTASVAVVFTPGGLFSDAKRAEFHARIINPFIDYYADLHASGDIGRLVSINVQTMDTPDYPYGIDAIFEGGGYIGFLITETAGVVDLWLPDCMGPCPFSEDFKGSYPDLVATVEATY